MKSLKFIHENVWVLFLCSVLSPIYLVLFYPDFLTLSHLAKSPVTGLLPSHLGWIRTGTWLAVLSGLQLCSWWSGIWSFPFPWHHWASAPTPSDTTGSSALAGSSSVVRLLPAQPEFCIHTLSPIGRQRRTAGPFLKATICFSSPVPAFILSPNFYFFLGQSNSWRLI